MLDKCDVQQIIDECRQLGAQGLGNGTKANITELYVDFLTPPADFIGLENNPAIFINSHTYILLGKKHPNWQINKTIAVKEAFLTRKPMMIIGVLVHEAGHAFNVAAGISNSELNAYIFEIETLCTWFLKGNVLLQHCSTADLTTFFEDRLPFYRLEMKHSPYLASLVNKIEDNYFNLLITKYESSPKIQSSVTNVFFNPQINPTFEINESSSNKEVYQPG